jgi:DUF2892 family protein
MAKNMATLDRLVRAVIVAPVAVVAAYFIGLTTAVGAVLVALALVMLLTAVAGICPLYIIFGLRTNTAR